MPINMYKKSLFFLCLFLSISTRGQLSNEALGAELDQFILSEMSSKNFPGLSTCIVKENQVIWNGDYGIANFETNAPVGLETLFTVASISKLFTATACAQLLENGKIIWSKKQIEKKLKISGLSKSLFFVKFTSGQDSISRKLIKQ